jgi:glucosamine--fructose-6-phosphate aminotransferase (isomerizing)
MEAEVRESAAVVAGLADKRDQIAELAARLSLASAPLIVLCGRGSSGHAGVYLRYLIETRLGLPVSIGAPSVMTTYGGSLALAKAVFIVISQSGASPDLVTAVRSARRSGARTLAIVNATPSPLAEAAEFVLPVNAGLERSVAATKTVIASMAAGAELVGAVAGDRDLAAALHRLPQRLERALELEWIALAEDLGQASAAFVLSRGIGLGPAGEMALKFAEVLRLPALAYSAAEIQHGPRAALSRRTPVLALRLDDQSAVSVDEFTAELRAGEIPVHLCGGSRGNLPWLGDDHPATDGITMLVPFYRAVERIARDRGLDPDHPLSLNKITRTF